MSHMYDDDDDDDDLTAVSNEMAVERKITDSNTKEDGEQLLAETEGRRRYVKEHELFCLELFKMIDSY